MFMVLTGNLKVGKLMLCRYFVHLNTDSFMRSIYYNILYANFLKNIFFMKLTNW